MKVRRFWTIFFGVMAVICISLFVYSAVFTNGFGNYTQAQMSQTPTRNVTTVTTAPQSALQNIAELMHSK